MHKAFLNPDQMKDYLTFLTESDLLRYDKEMRIFKTSEKGHRLLELYDRTAI